MRVKIGKANVDAAEPGTTDRFLWDLQIPGFGLRVRPSGGKHYVFRYSRGKRGLTRWYTIGEHGTPAPRDSATGAERTWTVDIARSEAARLRGLVESGEDPAAARDARKSVPTLAEFSERYVREYAEPHKGRATVEADRGLLGLRVKPKRAVKDGRRKRTILRALGSERVDRIGAADVTRFHLSWKDTPTRANRALALLSHLFNMAEKWGVRPPGTNPCRHVDRFKEQGRERFLSASELARLGQAIARLSKGKGALTPYGLAALRLLVFTGARASEVLGFRWTPREDDEGGAPGPEGVVDLAAGSVRLATSKTGAKTIFLNPPALAVLTSLPRLSGNPYAIVGGRKGRPLTLSGLEQVWQEVRRVAKLDDVRMHDLRHSFASAAVAGGQSLVVIGALLGHAQAQTTKRYAHLASSPAHAAAGAVGRAIASAMNSKVVGRKSRRQR